jgi:hypothetical protein
MYLRHDNDVRSVKYDVRSVKSDDIYGLTPGEVQDHKICDHHYFTAQHTSLNLEGGL